MSDKVEREAFVSVEIQICRLSHCLPSNAPQTCHSVALRPGPRLWYNAVTFGWCTETSCLLVLLARPSTLTFRSDFSPFPPPQDPLVGGVAGHVSCLDLKRGPVAPYLLSLSLSFHGHKVKLLYILELVNKAIKYFKRFRNSLNV